MASSYPKILLTGTQAEYNSIASKDSNKLYWTSDTHKIYKGSVDFTEYVKAVSTRPTAVTDLAAGTLYLCADTGKADFYDGTNWHTLNLPEVASFDDTTADDNHVPTTEAVKEYVASVIGGSSDVVKSIAAGSTAGVFTYETADDVEHNVTVPAVGVTLSAGTNAAEVKLSHTTGSDDSITVPLVVTGLGADASDAAKLNVTTSTGSHADVVVPKVMTGISAASGSGNNGKLSVTMSSGTHADVTVPGVIKSITMENRVFTITDTDGQSSTIDIGKDIFIDPDADNRYENGNIYLYLNDGETTSQDTEIVIPVTALITDYFGDDTDSISVDIDNTTHKVTASAILRQDVADTTAGAHDGFTNALKLSSSTTAVGGKGLYVDLSDVEESIDALAEAITWGSFV